MSKINMEETKNKLFGFVNREVNSSPTIHTANDVIESPGEAEAILPKKETNELTEVVAQGKAISLSAPKWVTLEKVNVLLAPEQKERLDKIVKKLMKFRSKDLKGRDDKERITTNTLIRALIANFLDNADSLNLETLSSEDDVYKWVGKCFK